MVTCEAIMTKTQRVLLCGWRHIAAHQPQRLLAARGQKGLSVIIRGQQRLIVLTQHVLKVARLVGLVAAAGDMQEAVVFRLGAV